MEACQRCDKADLNSNTSRSLWLMKPAMKHNLMLEEYDLDNGPSRLQSCYHKIVFWYSLINWNHVFGDWVYHIKRFTYGIHKEWNSSIFPPSLLCLIRFSQCLLQSVSLVVGCITDCCIVSVVPFSFLMMLSMWEWVGRETAVSSSWPLRMCFNIFLLL